MEPAIGFSLFFSWNPVTPWIPNLAAPHMMCMLCALARIHEGVCQGTK